MPAFKIINLPWGSTMDIWIAQLKLFLINIATPHEFPRLGGRDLKIFGRKRGKDKCVSRQEAGLPIFCASAIKIEKAFESYLNIINAIKQEWRVRVLAKQSEQDTINTSVCYITLKGCFCNWVLGIKGILNSLR